MHALRFCLAVIALTLALAAPAAAQVDSRRALAVKQLLAHIGESSLESVRDAKVQKALVAAGALDARVGHASARELRAAVNLFRNTHKDFKGRTGPLQDDEQKKLAEIYEQFQRATGLKPITDPTSGVTFLLPEKLIDNAPQPTLGNEVEYRETNWAAAIGPVRLPLAQITPIALFRERVLGSDPRDPRLERRVYKDPYLAPDEFRALGEVTRQSDDPAVATDSYSFFDQVLTDGGELKGIFMRYAMQKPPKLFRASDFDFLLPMLEASASEMDTQKREQRVWQLLMQAVTNLIASDLPNQNGWKDVSTKDCPLLKEAEGEDIRILFGTDRKFNKDALESQRAESQRTGADAAKIDPDKMFANERGGQLRLGCAYVSTPPKGNDWSNTFTPEYRIIELEPHSTDPNDFGDRLRLTDEIGGGNPERERQNALVFIQGYNVSFKDALAVLAKLKSETNYRGRVYLYSWPSLVSTLSYITDLDNAEQAEPYFQSFMRMLMRDANIDEIDVLAHSAGSQTLLRTVNALRPIFDTQKELFDTEKELNGQRAPAKQATVAQRSKSIRIGQMIFAAPDVERNVFDQKLRRIAPFAERVTVYVSSTDVALLASKFLRGGNPRAGDLDRSQTPPQPVQVDLDNVHIIDATGDEAWYRFDRIFFRSGSDQDYGHDYFIRNTDVVHDITAILQSRGVEDIKTPIERAKDRFNALPYKDANGKCLAGKFYYQFKSKMSQMTTACEGRE
jgi:esterase/lipase superfamily enzyme